MPARPRNLLRSRLVFGAFAERTLEKRFGTIEAKKTKVQIVRYTDDFVVLANSKELL